MSQHPEKLPMVVPIANESIDIQLLGPCDRKKANKRKRRMWFNKEFFDARTFSGILILLVFQGCFSWRFCHSQNILPQTETTSLPITSSTVVPSSAEHRYNQEGFFVNGTSYVVISETLRLERGSHIGFSFRTCTSGELLRQTGSGNSLDEIRMHLNSEGSLVFTLAVGDQKIEEVVGTALNDAQWHTVVLRVSENNEELSLSVSHGSNSSSAVMRQHEIIRDLDLSANNPQLRVGAGLITCIREGPGVRFTKPSVTVNSVAVLWGSCLLPETCSGYDWSALVDTPTITCDQTFCQNGGVCLPNLSNGNESSSTPVCLCPPGFTGSNCGLALSTCEERPCLHGASCTEDPSGGTGYECQCSSGGYHGRHCEIEVQHCVQGSCSNGGACLNQPTGFLCECTPQFSGLRCENTARARTENPCLSQNPCQNEGTCTFSTATNIHTCICSPGFTGRDCEIDLCQTQNCPQNSNCIRGTECQCLPGFQENGSGPTLSCDDIDECQSSPCLNSGTCINLQNGFRCQCPNGFDGLRCEDAVNYCLLNNRCQNGGTCRNLPDSASIACDCPDGFTNVYCQDDINECLNLPGPCLNNAQCQNLKGSFSCQCEPGWTGTHCDVNIDECLSNPCQNNATCNDLVNTFECSCLPGFEGPICSFNTDDCAASPCLNGGTCTDQINNFTCTCTPQFMGPTCQTNYDPCVENSCQNGGQCIVKKRERDPGNDFYCECPPGFNGLRCENDINECEGISCTNNMICIDLIASHECRCPQGFAGDNCTVEIDDCLSNPCLNGASCIDRTDGFDCQCTIGWAGQTCSEDVDECVQNEKLCNNGICRNTEGSYECYCRPGFSGSHCNHDFDECLSRPCQNDGACSNLVNSYQCTCAAGFEGINCEINIDECQSNLCLNNATCIDGINNFTCNCQPGFTGWLCETNIDECESNPCLNNGSCMDGINSYDCHCGGTGFEGQHCEINIDECATAPCQNNATCIDQINDYNCECFEGYGGKNCDQDISECMNNPCLNDGLCFELSNTTLYQPEEVSTLPMDLRQYFERDFSYFNASGYVCGCMPGYEGTNCEINIDECEPHPCRHGTCTDDINRYICTCDSGYEGEKCEQEIDECERYNPCENGVCTDHIADYECECNPNFGGKNCSVALTGCDSVACLNGGSCSPWLIGETDHRANCTCTAGFDGLRCQSRTTFSLSGLSYIKVPSDRAEGYELHMKFKTTIGNGLVAIGQGNTHFSLQLRNGRLNLHSNLISKYEGIIIGENLNNTNWQKVYVAVNASHLTLGVNDQLQATQPINPTGDNDTVFFNTFIGGIVRDQEILANNAPSFIGCIQDIVVNEMKITEEDFIKENKIVEQVNTEPGCIRKDQCKKPNPCQNEGICTDLWNKFQCTCHRPFLGSACQYNYTAATFGHENTTNSIAFVDIIDPAPFRSGVDISMFIRTREESGFIFYLGSDLHHPQEAYITGQLVKGNLIVNVNFYGKPERFQVYTVNLSDGYRHFIRVVRMNNSMMVKVNETVSINHEIPSPTAFNADKLYLGNFPTDSADEYTRQPTQSRTPHLITSSTPSTTTTIEDLTTTINGDLSSEEFSETTISFLVDGPTQESVTSETVQAGQQQIEADLTQFNEILPNNESTLSVEETSTNQEGLEEAFSAPIPAARARREQNLNQNDFGFTDLQDFKPPHFKGVIQDIQISDGVNVTRIVELFKLDFNDVATKPDSIGEVHLINVKQGIISDNTCRSNPCLNGGTCHVTWNDYSCECPEGYKGRDCTDKEYCHWFTCPHGSNCVSLDDGHECISNATFNGVNSSVVLSSKDFGNLTAATISVTFRTQQNGTLLHILGQEGKFIRIAVSGSKLVIEVPENESESISTFGRKANNGKWHTVVIRFLDGIVTAYMDTTREEQLSLDLSVDLETFISTSEIIVGASHGHGIGTRDQYQFSTSFGDTTAAIDIHTHGSYGDHFRGCIGEVRVGGILVPFFTDIELVNTTALKRFIVESRLDVSTDGCILCFEQECQNGGVCQNPSEVFQCQCPEGFEDDVCSTNIDECITSLCTNGYCKDGIANYTCTCLRGWTGWLCDEDLDECLSSPCQNGGTCEQTEEPGNYNCSCLDDFKGHNCEELKIKTCDELPCKNGGTCRPGQNPTSDDLYTCDCTTGFRGIDCEIKKNFCEEFQFPCQNGATCISIESTFFYKCVCPPGYTGDNCENEINECDPNPCNRGKCTDLLDGFECNCKGTGFEGPTCHINIDECLTNPCVQGNCTDIPGSYQCDCLQGYCGTNCQREDPCQLTDGLCKNEGVCQPSCDETPFYVCACTSEWEGHNCTIKSPRRGGDIALIVGPVVGGILFIAIIAVLVFLIMARKKRKSEGKYKPATQELTSPRLQLDNIIKPPPEERLI